MTVDHLAWEAAQAERHEYIDGEVFARVGEDDCKPGELTPPLRSL